jgi:hypothetical protein
MYQLDLKVQSEIEAHPQDQRRISVTPCNMDTGLDFEHRAEFTYSLLNGLDDFRLIVLHHGSGDQALRCTLTHHRFDGGYPEYQALSYFCGPQEPCKTIEVNGCKFHTTRNAYDALKTLRKVDEDITLWTDAVCIHQTDDAEKGNQVQLMSRIYSRASQVVVWLGMADDRNDKVFDLLQALDYAYAPPRALFRNSQMQAFQEVLGPLADREHQDALVELFHRPWMRRLWVVQEVALAQKVIFRCANRQVSWDGMCLGLQFLIVSRTHKKTTVGSSSTSLNTSFQDMHKIKEILDHFTKGRDINHIASVPSIMYRYAPFTATRAADYVYGLLGILDASKHGTNNRIKVDYSKSAAEIFTSATKYCLAVDQTWDIFSVCDYYHTLSDSSSKLNIPSWVPEFSKHGSGKTISFILGDNPVHVAGGSKCLQQGTDYWFEDNGSVLVVKGVLVDTVDHVSKPGIVDKDFIGWCRAAQELAASSGVPDEHVPWNCWGAARPVSRFRKLVKSYQHITVLKHFEDLVLNNASLKDSMGREDVIAALRKSDSDPEAIDCAIGWMTTVTKYIRRRRFVVTSAKRPALANRNARVGDQICVLPGGKVPFVLRSTDNPPDTYELVGDCFVTGIMNGEALKMPLQAIRLV